MRIARTSFGLAAALALAGRVWRVGTSPAEGFSGLAAADACPRGTRRRSCTSMEHCAWEAMSLQPPAGCRRSPTTLRPGYSMARCEPEWAPASWSTISRRTPSLSSVPMRRTTPTSSSFPTVWCSAWPRAAHGPRGGRHTRGAASARRFASCRRSTRRCLETGSWHSAPSRRAGRLECRASDRRDTRRIRAPGGLARFRHAVNR